MRASHCIGFLLGFAWLAAANGGSLAGKASAGTDHDVAMSGKDTNPGEREFTPPTSGENNDWVLVLDDATQGFRDFGKLKR